MTPTNGSCCEEFKKFIHYKCMDRDPFHYLNIFHWPAATFSRIFGKWSSFSRLHRCSYGNGITNSAISNTVARLQSTDNIYRRKIRDALIILC